MTAQSRRGAAATVPGTQEDWPASLAPGTARRARTPRDDDAVAIQPLYTAADLAGVPHLDSRPGEPPFLRGAHASMYAGRPWTIRQYGGFSTAAATNAAYRAALAAGQTGLSVAFDLPTHRGYDSDHPHVVGEVGAAGVAIDSVEDMRALFDGIPLGAVSVSMTMSGAVLPVFAAFIVAAEEQGVPRAALRGTIQNDILKEFLVRNAYIHPPRASMRIAADVMAFAAAEMRHFNAISVSGYHMQEAGADAVRELAFTLANGLEYIRAALARGIDIDAIAAQMSFFFGIGTDFFTEIAKLRAARLLWARLIAAFAPRQPASLALRMHCQTSGVSLQARDPETNIVRTTIEALAAVLGGTQSLHTNGFDEALGLPGDAASRIARNTQLVLQHETGLTEVIDPLGGSYLVERLTRELAERTWQLIERIEAGGGMLRAIEHGWAKREIEALAIRRQAAIDSGAQVVVGVNRCRAPARASRAARRIDSGRVRAEQTARLHALRAQRDPAELAFRLEALSAAARDGGNLLAATIGAMRARATVGEVSDRLRAAFGTHDPVPAPIRSVYGALAPDAAWRTLRHRVAAVSARAGRPPRLLIVKLGQDGHDRGAQVIASALADLGFEIVRGPLFQTPEAAAGQAVATAADIVGISSMVGAHVHLLPSLIAALRRAGSKAHVVCGGIVPAADRAALRRAGVVAIFGPGASVPDCAARLLRLLRRG